jgi:DNA polymerase I-like protein with 3'-5' exonuclease and polymerase domains
MAGLPTRDLAKTFIYAFLYGAGASKIGKIVQGNAETGQQLIDRFLDNVPNLRRIRSQVQEAGEQGKIKGLDGRLLMVRSPHASLNLLIQGAGAIICKVWLVRLMKKIYRSGVEAKLVASVHDEYQFEVQKNDAAEFGKLTNEAIKEAQNILQLNCPLDSEFKVGETWAQTH